MTIKYEAAYGWCVYDSQGEFVAKFDTEAQAQWYIARIGSG